MVKGPAPEQILHTIDLAGGWPGRRSCDGNSGTRRPSARFAQSSGSRSSLTAWHSPGSCSRRLWRCSHWARPLRRLSRALGQAAPPTMTRSGGGSRRRGMKGVGRYPWRVPGLGPCAGGRLARIDL